MEEVQKATLLKRKNSEEVTEGEIPSKQARMEEAQKAAQPRSDISKTVVENLQQLSL